MRETPPPDREFGPSLPQSGEAADPIAMARRDLKKALPRRFFKEAAAQERDGNFVLLLDGRAAKTPGGNAIGDAHNGRGAGPRRRMVSGR